MINTITIDFLDQQIDGTKFGYRINENDVPLLYDNGADIVFKEFKGSNLFTKGRIADFNGNLVLNSSGIGTFNATVVDSAVRPDGIIVVVGEFTSYTTGSTTFTSNGIIFLNPNGTVATTFATAPTTIKCVAIQSDNKVVIGGDFTSFAGTSCNRLCRLNSNGSVDTAFVANIMSASSNKGFNGTVSAILVHPAGQSIYVGGSFTNFNNNARNRIVNLNPVGTINNTYNVGTGFDSGRVNTITSGGSQVYIGGLFNSYRGNASKNLVATDSTNGSFYSAYNVGSTGFNGEVKTIAWASISSGSYHIVGGDFTTYKGTSANKIVAISSANATRYNTFNIGTGFNNSVNDIRVSSTGDIYVGGSFTTYKGATCSKLAKLNTSATLTASPTNIDLTVNTICGVITSVITEAILATSIIVGGSFNIITQGVAPTQSQTTIPIGSTFSETLTNALTNLETYNTNPNISYSIVGDTIEVGWSYSIAATNSITNIVKTDNYIDLQFEGFSQIIEFDNFNLYLAQSPVWVTYTAPANLWDYFTLDLYVWSGENATPGQPTYTDTAYKARTIDNYHKVRIDEFLQAHLNPRLDESWYTNVALTVDTTNITVDSTFYTADATYYTLSDYNSYNEVVWFRYVLKSYKLNYGIGTLYETVDSGLNCATLGKGYFLDGANPHPPTTTLTNPVDKFSTCNSIVYKAVISTTASNTNAIIKRNPITTNEVIDNWGNREFQIVYLNKWGIWDSFLFNRASKRTINVNSEKYQHYQMRPDFYDKYTPTTRVYNVSAKEEWVLNTDILDEAQNYYMEELVMSSRWYLIDVPNNMIIPVILVDNQFREQIDKYEEEGIQWSLKFESAFNKINDII